jgi:hypothetical protein
MRPLLLVVLLAAGTCAVADPHADYLLFCRGCHLHTGEAVPAANVPSLRELGSLLKSEEGREYIIRVPGVSQTPMSDERLAAVLNWVMSNFNGDTLPDNFKPYTADEVGSARKKLLIDPLKTRAEILSD